MKINLKFQVPKEVVVTVNNVIFDNKQSLDFVVPVKTLAGLSQTLYQVENMLEFRGEKASTAKGHLSRVVRNVKALAENHRQAASSDIRNGYSFELTVKEIPCEL